MIKDKDLLKETKKEIEKLHGNWPAVLLEKLLTRFCEELGERKRLEEILNISNKDKK